MYPVTLSNHAHCPAHDPTIQQQIFYALHMTPHYVRSKDQCSAHLQANTRSLITRLAIHSHSDSYCLPRHAVPKSKAFSIYSWFFMTLVKLHHKAKQLTFFRRKNVGFIMRRTVFRKYSQWFSQLNSHKQ